jgi:hypothetical protein
VPLNFFSGHSSPSSVFATDTPASGTSFVFMEVPGGRTLSHFPSEWLRPTFALSRGAPASVSRRRLQRVVRHHHALA